METVVGYLPIREVVEIEPEIRAHATDYDLLPIRFGSDSSIVATSSSIVSTPDHRELVPVAVKPFALLAHHDSSQAIELSLTSVLTGETETIRVDVPLVVIGRGSQCDVRLTHPDVSRRHACVHLLRDRALCVDLGSRTGVFWEGERRQNGWLQADRPVRIGPFELRLATPMPAVDGVQAETLFRRHPIDETGFQGAGLRFLNQPMVTPPVSLARPITLIGRAEHCKLRLRDESVSRVHSSLMLTPDGVWIADLLGRGGVKVNGEFVSLARLAAGDEVQIGRYRMTFATDVATVADATGDPTGQASAPTSNGKPAVCAGQGGVSESLLLAVTETFADMQRQMHDQFRFQMELMVGLVESMRKEMNGEIRQELARLLSIGEEIRDTQRRLAERAVPTTGCAGEERPLLDRPLAGRSEFDRSGHAQGEAAKGAKAARRPASESGADRRSADGVADHVFMARRLRDLEQERNSRWLKLVGLLKGES
ncbi:MAG: FHA domain-containing protein [Planctomycetaceae bacterium]